MTTNTNDRIHVEFTVDQSPQAVFDAITNVAAWWTGEIVGTANRVGAEFTYRHQDLHTSRQRVTELVPGERVAWHVEDATLTFLTDTHEWTGTDITFDITQLDGQTRVEFNHHGLNERSECWDMCTQGWAFFAGDSLRHLITTGRTIETTLPVTP